MKMMNRQAAAVVATLVVCSTLALIAIRPVACDDSINHTPLVGILTQPTHSSQPGDQMIKSHHVVFIESAGARAIAVPYNSTPAELDELYSNLNGLWLPGGSHTLVSSNTTYMKTARYLIQRAMADGDFPIGGNCLGIETLIGAMAGTSLRDLWSNKATDVDKTRPLSFMPNATESWLFKDMDPAILAAFEDSDSPIAYNHHAWGILLNRFNSIPALTSMFDVLATGRSEKTGDTYVQIVAGKKPLGNIFAMQFETPCPHACWKSNKISRTDIAISAMEAIGRRLVTAAAANSHHPKISSMVPSMLVKSQSREYFEDTSSYCVDGCFAW